MKKDELSREITKCETKFISIKNETYSKWSELKGKAKDQSVEREERRRKTVNSNSIIALLLKTFCEIASLFPTSLWSLLLFLYTCTQRDACTGKQNKKSLRLVFLDYLNTFLRNQDLDVDWHLPVWLPLWWCLWGDWRQLQCVSIASEQFINLHREILRAIKSWWTLWWSLWCEIIWGNFK